MATDGGTEAGQPILLELKNEAGSTVLHMVAPVGVSLPPVTEMLQGGNMAGLQAALLQAFQAQSGQLLQPIQIQAVEPVSLAPTPTAQTVMVPSSAPITLTSTPPQALRPTCPVHEKSKQLPAGVVKIQGPIGGEKVPDMTYLASSMASQAATEEVSPLQQVAGGLMDIPLTPRNDGVIARQTPSTVRPVEDPPTRMIPGNQQLGSQSSLLAQLSNSLGSQNGSMIDISSQLLGEAGVEEQSAPSVFSLPRAIPGKDYQLPTSMDFEPSSASVSQPSLLSSQGYLQPAASPRTTPLDSEPSGSPNLHGSLTQTQQSALAAVRSGLQARLQTSAISQPPPLVPTAIRASGLRPSGPVMETVSPAPHMKPLEPNLEQLTILRQSVGQGLNLAPTSVTPTSGQHQSPLGLVTSKPGTVSTQQLRLAPASSQLAGLIASQLASNEPQRSSGHTDNTAAIPLVAGTRNVMPQGPLRLVNGPRVNSSGMGDAPSLHFLMGSPASEGLLSSGQLVGSTSSLAANAGLAVSMLSSAVPMTSSVTSPVYSLSTPQPATTSTAAVLRPSIPTLPTTLRPTQPRAVPSVAAPVVMPAPQTPAELQQRQSELQEQLKVKLAQLQSLQLQQQQLLLQQPLDTSLLLGQKVKLEGATAAANMVANMAAAATPSNFPTMTTNTEAIKAQLRQHVQQQQIPAPPTDSSQQDTLLQQQVGLLSDSPKPVEILPATRSTPVQQIPSSSAPRITPLSDIAHLVGVSSSAAPSSTLSSLLSSSTSVQASQPPVAATNLSSFPGSILLPPNFTLSTAPRPQAPPSPPPAVPPPVIQVLPIAAGDINPNNQQEKVITIEMVVPNNGPQAADIPIRMNALPTGSKVDEDTAEETDMESATKEKPSLVFSDRKLWCEDCHESVQAICWRHGTLAKVRDRIIPCRAKLTAPHHISIKTLELRAGGKHIMGAFAKKVIQKRTEFGPFEGDLMPMWPHKGKGLFAVKLIGEDGMSQFYDSSNQNTGNWLIYVRPARTVKEQNMVAYQYRGRIYFTSIRAIPPNAELKVWYAESYARALGVPLLSEVQRPGSLIDVELREQVSMDVMEKPETTPASPAHSLDDEDDGDQLVINDEETALPLEASEVEAILPPEQSHSEDLPGAPEELLAEMSAASAVPVETPTVDEKLLTHGGWTCVACSAIFPTPQGLDAHECMNEMDTGRRTRSKRKGNPVKIASPAKKATGETPLKRKRGRPRKNPLPSETEQPAEILPLETDAPPSVSLTEVPQPAAMVEHPAAMADLPVAEPVPDSTTSGVEEATDESKMMDRKRKVVRKKLRQPKSLFSCGICNKAFSTDGKLKTHTYIHTGERPFPCTYPGCDKTFTSKFKLLRHELIHTGEKSFSCPYCERTFTRKDHLKNHLKIHDPNKVMFKCTNCEKEYASPFAFKTHMAFHAVEEGEMVCLVCKKEYTDKKALIKHLKVHAGARSVKEASEKNQVCPLCNKRFFTRKDVKRHLVVHTKDRDFLCQFCPQRFGRRDHLIRHLKKAHSNEASNLSLVCDNDLTLISERIPGEENDSSHIVSQLLHSVAQGMMDPLAPSQANLKEETTLNTLSLNLPSGLTVALPNTTVPSSVANLPNGFLNYNISQTPTNPAPVRQYTPQNFTPDPPQPTNTVQVMAGHFVPPSFLPIASEGASTPNQITQTLVNSHAQLGTMTQLKSVPTDTLAKPDGATGNSHMVINYTVKNILDAYSAASTATTMATPASLSNSHT